MTAGSLPSLLTGTLRVFVGRDRELERLGQLWKEASAGELRVAFLAGEPGVGKTRLAAQLARQVHGPDATVLAGTCGEDLGVPYQPFVEALRHFIDHSAADQQMNCLGRYPGELVRLVPELADRLPGLPPPLSSDPETERYRLFDAVAGWLAGASRDRPVLLVIDDLQWAAKPTLLLLSHIARSAEPMRLLVIGTYRDTEIGRDHPLGGTMADMRRLTRFERLSLSGFDPAGVLAFLEEAADHNLDEEGAPILASAIYEETDGNPFFVVEVVRHLTETGGIDRRDGRWIATLPVENLGIPEGVRDVIGRRLSRLSKEANRVLGLAAVIGLEFDLAVLGPASGLGEDALASVVDEAIAARLAADVPGSGARCRFSHALVREALYSEFSGARRVALHRRVAEAIEDVYCGRLQDHLPALTRHYARAAAPNAETLKAVSYAAQAGDRALAQLAHDEAVAYYRQALELQSVAQGPVDEARRLGLLISLGEAQRRAGEPAHRETLLQAADLARRRSDAPALALAALANTRGFLPARLGSADGERVAMLEAAVSAIGHQDPRTRARLLATLGVELAFASDWQRCLALSDEALALARSLDDPETLARVLLARFFPTCVPDLLQERLANTAELLAVAESVPDPALVAEAQVLRGRTALEAGEVEEADRCFAAADLLSAGLGQPALRFRVAYNLAGRAIAAGRLPEAQRYLVEARELGRLTALADIHWFVSWQQCVLSLEQGCLDDEVVRPLEEIRRESRVPVMDSLLAVAACELGREDQARTALEGLDSTPVPFDIYWLATMMNWATVAAHVGDAIHADRLEAALRPYAGRVTPLSPAPTPSVAHHLGLLATALGRYDEAERCFREATAIHERIAAPHRVARTRLEWARMLLARRDPGDEERARDLLDAARREFESLDLTPWVQRTEELSLGLSRPKRRLPGGPSTLGTASGRSRREAEAVGVSFHRRPGVAGSLVPANAAALEDLLLRGPGSRGFRVAATR